MRPPSVVTRFYVATAATWPSLLWAAEEHAEHHPSSIQDLGWPLANFTLFAFLLYRYAWPAVTQGLAERRRSIENEIAEAEKTHREVESELREIEGRKARLREDAERIRGQLRAEAEHERAALVKAARATAERIRDDAQRFGEQEAARAAHRIRDEMALRVIRRAAEILSQRLGPSDQERFVQEFLSGVESGALP